MNIMTIHTPVMVLPIIPAHTCRWVLAGGGIPFSIGASLTIHGMVIHITMLRLTTGIILGILGMGATIQAMDIRATGIRATGPVEPA